MKRKAIPALCAAGLLALALTGCGTAGGQAEYIGIDAAKAVALEAAGVSESAATFSTAGLDRRNGMDYYAVDFTAGGQSYEYDIDAVTGVVIDSNTGGGAADTPGGDDGGAAAEAPASASPSPSASQTAAGQTTSAAVTEEQARETALSHAGLTADQVTFVRSKLDWDDGRQVYDVEFYTADYTEYDYEIDAATGEIRSYDADAEGYSYQPDTTPGTAITAEQARAIALAEVPGASEGDIYEFETDRDDGRLEYEGKIIYNSTEYEFTIDGYSGAIRSWESEPLRW